MIYYNFITIILFLVIFILILKFKDFKIENYQTPEASTTPEESTTSSSNPTLDCSDITNNSIECNISRLMKDKRINNHILQLLKNSQNTNRQGRLNQNNENISVFLENTMKNKENVDKILGKLRQIDSDSDEKLASYLEEKRKADKYILEFTDSLIQPNEDNAYILTDSEFVEKNNQLRNKLAEYYDKIKNINKKPFTKNENILILKNYDNNLELNLVDVDKKIKMFNEYKNLQSKLYNLIINDNCVNFVDKYNYKFEKCNEQNNFLFTVNKIEDHRIYNKFIRYNNSSRDYHTLEGDEKGVEYPFYIICPLNNNGVCVTYEDNKIAFKPIRNNPKQRFKKILNSNFCSY